MPIDHLVLFDGAERNNLLPMSATRALADFRIGVLTIREKWEKHFDMRADVLTQKYLQPKYSYFQKPQTVFVNAAILPDKNLVRAIEKLETGSVLVEKSSVVAIKTDIVISSLKDLLNLKGLVEHQIRSETQIQFPWNIFMLNGQQIASDIRLLGLKPNSDILSKTNQLLGRENIYVEESVCCECSIINATTGPVIIGKNAEIMEGCTIRGAFSLGRHSTLKMQTKIYGDTSIGPHCKVGGEVSNTVIFGYSNKAHDGFLGNAVIGEWCNLGADTNNSNLKNNYGNVRAWNYEANDYINTQLQFCGLIMGDHSKCGINTMFNTGTVTGVSANIFGGGFLPKFIPDFSWGGGDAFEEYELDKMFEVTQRVMERRGISLSETDKNILRYVFDETKRHRK